MINLRQVLSLAAATAVILNYVPVYAEVVDRIVAIVNNDIITLSELNKAAQPYRQNVEASQNSNARKKELLRQMETDMLNQLVETSLANQEAEKFGIKVTDEDVDRAVENFKQENRLDDEGLERGLAASGMTLADYRKRLKTQIQQSMLVNRAVRSKIIITDEDVQEYYTAHKDQFTGIRKYRLRNILTRTSEDMDLVKAKLKQNVPFQELAEEYSIGSNASEGGALGLFDITSFSEEIRNALEGLEKGGFTPVLQTGGAFQIIYVDDIVLEGSQTVDQAKKQIQDILFREQGQQQYELWIESLKKNAHIKLML